MRNVGAYFRPLQSIELLSVLIDNLVIVLGPPRSGTTLLTRCIGQHRRVQCIVEPYQSLRSKDYKESNLSRLCEDFGIVREFDGSLLVKETFTRTKNVECIFELAQDCSRRGVPVTIIQVVRSPLAGFDSQVVASREKWQKNNSFQYNQQSLRQYLRSFVKHFLLTLEESRSYKHMLVQYERFCALPEAYLQNIMPALGLGFESCQLEFKRSSGVSGGDPSAYTRKGVVSIDQSDARERMKKSLDQIALAGPVLALHDEFEALAKEDIEQEVLAEKLKHILVDICRAYYPNLSDEILSN